MSEVRRCASCGSTDIGGYLDGSQFCRDCHRRWFVEGGKKPMTQHEEAVDLISRALLALALVFPERREGLDAAAEYFGGPDYGDGAFGPRDVGLPRTDGIVAGALFDFLGFLTSREKAVTFSGRHNSAPAVELLREWAETRGLSLDNARVADWHV